MTKPLDLKPINQLLGEHFHIPFYQRGYRWTEQQVNDLLNDIWAFANKRNDKIGSGEFYCLQPIVVKKKSWQENGMEINGYDVIDGQQRLTTLYIIIDYLTKEYLKVESLVEDYGQEIYSLRYETRTKSAEFLKNIKEDKSNIDFYHIYTAYNTVSHWFSNGKNTKDRNDRNKFLTTLLGKKEDERSVQVIWYDIDVKQGNKEDELKNSIEMFTRLNIGKIPLTNAELIKALFLSSTSFEDVRPEKALKKKMEISQIWDDIEHKLNDGDFWAFITNHKHNKYATKIELLFDLIAEKKEGEIDPLFTFLHFLKKTKTPKSLWDLWLSIEQYYLTLCEWHKNKDLYHKIGYLITIGESPRKLIETSINEKKSKFEDKLDERIRTSVDYGIDNLSYENKTDYEKIEKVLLLFNVESIRDNTSITEFYPFKFHKNTQWSLEHIHAQNSESMDKTKQEPWLKWLQYHEKLIKELIDDETDPHAIEKWGIIYNEIKELNNEKLTWAGFSSLSTKIIDKFSVEDDDQANDMHSISNLALLSQPDNSALNNSVFEVKRRDIIRMDKEGKYIPLCTKRVFLKYYNDKPSTQQFYFWGKTDKDNYKNEIKTVLEKYLPKELI